MHVMHLLHSRQLTWISTLISFLLSIMELYHLCRVQAADWFRILVNECLLNMTARLTSSVFFPPSSVSFQHLRCWGALWAGAATAAASPTSPAPRVTPQASASLPACQTSPSTSSIPTAPESRNLLSQACLRAQGH